jgi:hypothetical protein
LSGKIYNRLLKGENKLKLTELEYYREYTSLEIVEFIERTDSIVIFNSPGYGLRNEEEKFTLYSVMKNVTVHQNQRYEELHPVERKKAKFSSEVKLVGTVYEYRDGQEKDIYILEKA